MKLPFLISLAIISFTASAYFIEKTWTAMTIKEGVVTEFYLQDSKDPVELKEFEKRVLGASYSDCKPFGSKQLESCEEYYLAEEDIVISVKGYVIRDHERFHLDEDELKTLGSYRWCQDYIWKIQNEFNRSRMDDAGKAEYDNTLKEAKASCARIKKRWSNIKASGGKRSPDVVKNDDTSIWDRAKNYFFGGSAPEPAHSPEVRIN